ncbi:exported hypothetical protein [Verrucomicrobia bacterium]|nr:exported hypothetical protein [Verrucomicrobiota bacterium]
MLLFTNEAGPLKTRVLQKTCARLGLTLLTVATIQFAAPTGGATELNTPEETQPAAPSATPEESADARAQRGRDSALASVQLQRATALLGKKVEDRNFRTVGKLDDLILDLASGQAIAGLVGSGSKSQATLVPARAFWVADKGEIVLRASRSEFRGAPPLAQAVSGSVPEARSVDQTFRYFHQNPPAPEPVALVSARALIGATLLSDSNDRLGQVLEIMLDVPLGQVVYFVVQPLAGDATAPDLYVVPPPAVKRDATGALVLASGQAHFLAGPHFQKAFWTDLSFAELAVAVHEHYGLSPTGRPSDPERQPARALIQGTEATPTAAPARSDEEITKAILVTLVRDDKSWPERGITMKTISGRVTLGGRVKNEKERLRILAVVGGIVGPANVDDHLEVQPE